MISFSLINTFLVLAESGSFSMAARKLDISIPAASRQITRLETLLRTRLWDRASRPGKLTEVGTRYYEQVKGAILQLQEAERSLTSSEVRGTLNVTSNPWYARKILLPRLHEFRKRYPGLVLNLELAERIVHLPREPVDIFFGVSLEGLENYVRKPVGSTRYILCASPAYLAQCGIPENINALRNHVHIGHAMREFPGRISFRDGIMAECPPALMLNDSAAIAACTIEGLGMAWLHEYIIEEALSEGRLVEILPDMAKPAQPVYLYYEYRRHIHPAIRAFTDFFDPAHRTKSCPL